MEGYERMIEGEVSSEFYDNLCRLIDSTMKKVRSSTHGYSDLIEDTMNYVIGAYYANLIRLYQHNLNERFYRLVGMNREEREELHYRLAPYFRRANETDESVFNKGDLNFNVYQDFRSEIYEFGDDAYWLLLGVEEYANVIRCEHRIIQFKTDIKDIIE
jgi:hypothetical protein